MSKPLQSKDIFLSNAQKYIAYLLKQNLKDCFSFDANIILNSTLRGIVTGIQDLAKEHGGEIEKVDIDLVIDKCKQNGLFIEKSSLQDIVDAYSDFENIEILKRRLHQEYVKQSTLKKVIEDVFVNLDKNDDLDIKKIQELYDTLGEGLKQLDNRSKLLDYQTLIQEYRNTIQNRKDGGWKKSLGLPLLDRNINRPAEPGTMTSFIMRKGHGKTLLSKNMSTCLTNLGTCVLEFNFDMTMDTILDREVSIRSNIPASYLLMPEKLKQRNLLIQMDAVLNNLNSLPNYLAFPEGVARLSDVDAMIQEAKSIFKSKGVLPDNGYIHIVFDTVDMIEEFSKAKSAYEVKTSVDRLHEILKRQNCHAFNLLQANENKLRRNSFSSPSDCEYFRFGMEDAEFGATYTSRSRVVLTGYRPLQMKKEFFPNHDDRELWELEDDIFFINCVKQNDGKLFSLKYILDVDTFRLHPHIEENTNNQNIQSDGDKNVGGEST